MYLIVNLTYGSNIVIRLGTFNRILANFGFPIISLVIMTKCQKMKDLANTQPELN
jgi:hypothetical protein